MSGPEDSPEILPETGTEPFAYMTADEAAYFVGTLGGSSSGFDTPQTSDDPLVTCWYVENGLTECPTLAEIEPVAVGLWENPATRLRAVELVMGMRIDAQEIAGENSIWKEIFQTPDPQNAFAILLLAKSFMNE